eukprot:scpid104106/ scgid7025/ 
MGKISEKKKVASKWQPSWTKFRMKESRKGPNFVYCTVCQVDVNISGGGVHEIKRHMDTNKHSKALRDVATQPGISQAMSAGHEKTTLAEKIGNGGGVFRQVRGGAQSIV